MFDPLLTVVLQVGALLRLFNVVLRSTSDIYLTFIAVVTDSSLGAPRRRTELILDTSVVSGTLSQRTSPSRRLLRILP